MIDLHRITGLVVHCTKRKNMKPLKDALVNLAVKSDSDDVFIIGENAYQGPGEVTLGVKKEIREENTLIPDFRECFQAIGDIDCCCSKMVFIVSDYFYEDFFFNFKKMLKLSDTFDFNTKIFVFNFGEDCDFPKSDNITYYNLKLEDLEQKIIKTFEENKEVNIDYGEIGQV